MSEDEVKNKRLNLLAGLVKKLIDTNEQQERRGLKILTPKQMITRLPILLSQIHAGNYSEQLKNEIRQIKYSLYRSKTLSKEIYKNLVSTI